MYWYDKHLMPVLFNLSSIYNLFFYILLFSHKVDTVPRLNTNLKTNYQGTWKTIHLFYPLSQTRVLKKKRNVMCLLSTFSTIDD